MFFTLESSQLTTHDYKTFQDHIWKFYHVYKRDFAWRLEPSPYYVFVSEIMLQQTQTERVKEKFALFIEQFPCFHSLALASQAAVIRCWQGLGYNRRALYIHQAARHIVDNCAGRLPDKPEQLVTLPGIGPATAASMCAFAYNKPTLFIETNIRAVYIYTFFHGKDKIADRQLYPLLENTIDSTNPREWYYALMDYGVRLKKMYKNPCKLSKHYTRQSRFEGSDRQIRGMILRLLATEGVLDFNQLFYNIPQSEIKIRHIIECLLKEDFIMQSGELYSLSPGKSCK